MPLPRGLAEFNKRYTNRVAIRVAGWAPGFAIVHHTGRASGSDYHTPVNVFQRPDGYLFALTYGITDWVENVLSADGCTITTRGETIALTSPRLYTDPTRRDVPVPARWVLGWIDVDRFLSLRD